MTLTIDLNEEAEIVHILMDDHLSLRAEKLGPGHIAFHNFDALVDDEVHRAVKDVAIALLRLTA